MILLKSGYGRCITVSREKVVKLQSLLKELMIEIYNIKLLQLNVMLMILHPWLKPFGLGLRMAQQKNASVLMLNLLKVLPIRPLLYRLSVQFE